MKRTVSAFLAGLLLADAALAQGAPWTLPRPSEMTATHERHAQSAEAARFRSSGNILVNFPNGASLNGFGVVPTAPAHLWGEAGSRFRTHPVSNLDSAEIERMTRGRYFIYHTPPGNGWRVRYYADDGKTYFCTPVPGNRSREYVLDRYVHRTLFGLSGLFHWDPKTEATAQPDLARQLAFPLIANPATGRVADFFWVDGQWEKNTGWLQEDYAGIFAQTCPNLPRKTRVNERQGGLTIQEIARGARPVRSFSQTFENDPEAPLTAEMLYWTYPPK